MAARGTCMVVTWGMRRQRQGVNDGEVCNDRGVVVVVDNAAGTDAAVMMWWWRLLSHFCVKCLGEVCRAVHILRYFFDHNTTFQIWFPSVVRHQVTGRTSGVLLCVSGLNSHTRIWKLLTKKVHQREEFQRMKTLTLTEVQMLKCFQENKGLYNNKLKRKKKKPNWPGQWEWLLFSSFLTEFYVLLHFL